MNADTDPSRPDPSRPDLLRAELEALVVDGTRHIRTDRGRRARGLAIAGALDIAARMAALTVVLVSLAWLAGVSITAAPIALGIVLVCSGLAALVWGRARLLPVSREDALALWDRAAGLEDRLLAADEFLRGESRGEASFIAAAIEDAAGHVTRARDAQFEPVVHGVPLGMRSALAAVALGLLLATGFLPPDASSSPKHAGDPVVASAPGSDGTAADPDTTDDDPSIAPEPRPREERGNSLKASVPGAANRTEPGALSERIKESVGVTGSGRGADASASSKAGQAKGAPSGQSQISRPRAKKPEKPSKKETEPADPKEADQKQPDEQNSGSTAGQGSSKGSSKNPAATDWSSKDQVSTPDDAEIEEDEQTEDEEEEQEARGGVQPSLRDRRPPVSRDLRIGFGNRFNPDANGRGGPSAPKKSRGVASLVLGVPIPDRIKGQPGPGKTKVTQERIEPREEESAGVDASSRGTRQDPIGRLGQVEMSPWMRRLVRDYFVARRASDE